jgi:hypothetical protein
MCNKWDLSVRHTNEYSPSLDQQSFPLAKKSDSKRLGLCGPTTVQFHFAQGTAATKYPMHCGKFSFKELLINFTNGFNQVTMLWGGIEACLHFLVLPTQSLKVYAHAKKSVKIPSLGEHVENTARSCLRTSNLLDDGYVVFLVSAKELENIHPGVLIDLRMPHVIANPSNTRNSFLLRHKCTHHVIARQFGKFF